METLRHLAALLLFGSSPPEEQAQARIMDRIETGLRLPEGELKDYARYYTFEKDGKVVGIYTSFDVGHQIQLREIPLGQRIWVKDHRHLPHIDDGGCGVITIHYNPSSDVRSEPVCNGQS